MGPRIGGGVAAVQAPAYVIHSTAGDYEVLPPSASAILGEYLPEGLNHGRPIFRRRRPAGPAHAGDPEVLMFFWDTRDGKDLAGWWLGDRIGGGQVWARNESLSAQPPSSGWRCPVDGPVQEHVVCAAREDGDEDAEAWEPRAPQAQKRGAASQHAAADAGAGRPRKAAKTQALLLTSKLVNPEDLGLAAKVLGEYVQQGSNHGKRTYFKRGKGEDDPEDPSIWLYYWDSRDGRDFSGWWLGRSVGGAEVYGWAPQHASVPASKGWRVPHNDAVRHDLALMPRAFDEEADMAVDARAMKLQELVSRLEPEVQKAISTASLVLDVEDSELLEESVRGVTEVLQARVNEVEAACTSVSRHLRAASRHGAEGLDGLSGFEEQLAALKARTHEAFTRASTCLSKLESAHDEEQSAKAMEDLLPSALESVTQAELAADTVQSAASVADVRRQLAAAKLQVSRALEASKSFAPKAQRLAKAEFTALASRCEAAARKLAFRELDVAAATGGAEAGAEDAAEDTAEPEAMALEVEAPGDDAEGAPSDAGEAEEEEDAWFFGEEATNTSRLLLAAAASQSKRRRIEREADGLLPEASKALTRGCEVLEAAEVALAGRGLPQSRIETLLRQDAEVKTSLKALAAALKSDPDAAVSGARALGAASAKLKAVQARISKEITFAKREAAESASGDRRGAEASLPVALDFMDRAESAIEGLVAEYGDDDRWRTNLAAMGALAAAEAAARARSAVEEAEALLDEARARLELQAATSRQLPLEARPVALEELATALRRAAAAQQKLAPLRRVRAVHDRHAQQTSELDALSERVSAVEAKVAAARRKAGGLDAVAAEVEDELSHVVATLEVIGDAGAALRSRALSVREALEKGRARSRRRQRQAEGEALLAGVQAAVEELEAWLPRLAAAREASAAQGEGEAGCEAVMVTSLDEATAVAGRAEEAAKVAEAAVGEAMEEAKKLTEAVGVCEGLEVLLARVETVAARASKLRSETSESRARAQMPEAVKAVGACEARVAEVAGAAAPLGEDVLDRPSPPEGLGEACARVLELERAASVSCLTARQLLEARRQQDDGSSPLEAVVQRLLSRLSAASSQLWAFKQAAQAAGGSHARLRAHREALAKLEAAVSEAELANIPLGDEGDLAEATADARASAIRACRRSLAAWRRSAQADASSPHAALRLAMARLLERSKGLARQLDEAEVHGREWREPALCRLVLVEATDAFAKAEEAFAKAESAEGPFLKGLEPASMPFDEASSAARMCEAAVAAAEPLVAGVQTLLSECRKEVFSFKHLDPAVRESTSRTLEGLASKASGLGRRLGQFKRELQARCFSLGLGRPSKDDAAAATA